MLGFVGLGRMGANMVRRMRLSHIELAVFDRDQAVTQALAQEVGVRAHGNLADLVTSLTPPRRVWLMLPADAVTATINEIEPLLSPGDVIIDGANGYYKDSVERSARLKLRGIDLLDAGVSGGIWGLKEGYALMIGGAEGAVQALAPVFQALAPEHGWLHCGPAGAGHFVKMIHNGIEYGMMQAYAEGFALLKGKEAFALDVAAIAELWRHGSVVRSWLLDLTADFLQKQANLDDIKPVVADSGEGRWTALEAIEQGVPTPVMSTALMMRFASQGANDYSARLLAMMRNAFGGHAVAPEKKI